MTWLLIDRNSRLPIAESLEPIDDTDAAYAEQCPAAYPAAMVWSAAAAGFVDKPEPARMLSRLAYQRLFTQAERIAVRGSADPVVVDFRELAVLAETIDLADADVIAGTQYLEALGLIGPGRATAILASAAP